MVWSYIWANYPTLHLSLITEQTALYTAVAVIRLEAGEQSLVKLQLGCILCSAAQCRGAQCSAVQCSEV